MRATALLIPLLFIGCGDNKKPPDPVTVEPGTTVRFTVGNVEFTVNRFEPTRAVISVHNGNDAAVKIRVEGYDVPGVLYSREYQTAGSNSEETPTVSPGGTYNFRVWIWKNGFDLVTCPFTSDSCFRSYNEGLLKF